MQIDRLNRRPIGRTTYQWACRLFPISRSLTGPGIRETLRFFREQIPGLRIHEVASGAEVFDWMVPEEWTIRDAYVANCQVPYDCAPAE